MYSKIEEDGLSFLQIVSVTLSTSNGSPFILHSLPRIARSRFASFVSVEVVEKSKLCNKFSRRTVMLLECTVVHAVFIASF